MLTTSAVRISWWPALHRAVRAALAAAASLTFAILLLSLSHVGGIPLFLVAALGGLAAMAAWKPEAALLLLAAAIPVAAWTGRTWHGGVAWPETLAVAFAAGYLARPLWSPPRPRDGLHLPIAAFSAVVLASLAVRLLVLHWTIGGEALWLQIRELGLGRYFIGNGGFRELDAAMRLLEGMVLLRAAATASAESQAFAPRLVRWFVIGAAGAAALNLWRIWQGALRTETPVSTFFDYLMTLRYNVHYGDVNAAGSYFVMALLAAVGLALATRRVHWMAAAVLIVPSLMLSGSRSALAAGAVAAVVWAVPFTLSRRREDSAGRMASAVQLLVIACLVAIAFIGIAGRSVSASTALQIRMEFARTTARMLAAHPGFGVGVGRYPERSGEFGPSTTVEFFPVAGENAHNNFLQVLGELGVTGLAGFLWVLGAAGLAAARIGSGPLPRGVLMGLLAFVLTWLSGHPLLIDEPALTFWVVLGSAAGWGARASEASHTGAASRAVPAWVGHVATPALGLALLVSLPLRAQQGLAAAYLEHQGIGLSGWRTSSDGIRHRLAGWRSTVFIPSEAGVISLPIRSATNGPAGGAGIEVEIYLNGRLADVVRVGPDEWRTLALRIPDRPDAPRFLPLELRVADGSRMEGSLLMIGKAEAR